MDRLRLRDLFRPVSDFVRCSARFRTLHRIFEVSDHGIQIATESRRQIAENSSRFHALASQQLVRDCGTMIEVLLTDVRDPASHSSIEASTIVVRDIERLHPALSQPHQVELELVGDPIRRMLRRILARLSSQGHEVVGAFATAARTRCHV